MANILSQEEIDALLANLNEGIEDDTPIKQETKDNVKTYDFRTANKFAKEQMRTLNIIYDNYSRLLENYLTGTLRTQCKVDVVSVEELAYYEFTNSVPSPVILAVMGLAPLEGSLLLQMSSTIAFCLVNHLLGGTKGEFEYTRNFTEIELVIVEKIVRQMLRLMDDSWSKIVHVTAAFDRLETSPQFAQIVSLNETIAIVTLNVVIGEAEGLLNLIIPHMALEPIAKQLHTKSWYQSRTSTKVLESNSGIIKQRLGNTHLPVIATFNNTSLSVAEVLALQVGDVIELDHLIGEDLKIRIGHLQKFRGEIGVKNNKYAVKITGMPKEDDLEDE